MVLIIKSNPLYLHSFSYIIVSTNTSSTTPTTTSIIPERATLDKIRPKHAFASVPF